MSVKKRGHYRVRGSSGIITVPSDLIRHELFPLQDGYKVLIEIQKDRLIVSPLPRFEHLNTYENSARIYDNAIGRAVDIYFHHDGVAWCDHCRAPRCEHIEHALTLPEVKEPLKERGWRRRDATEL